MELHLSEPGQEVRSSQLVCESEGLKTFDDASFLWAGPDLRYKQLRIGLYPRSASTSYELLHDVHDPWLPLANLNL